MTFSDSDDFFSFQQQSFESPELRPILLPMSNYDKSSLDGMISMPSLTSLHRYHPSNTLSDLQNAGTAFPDSNAFGPYLSQPYPSHLPNQPVVAGYNQEGEPEYYSDNEFPYDFEYVDQKPMLPTAAVEPMSALKSSTGNAQPASRKRKASSEPEYAEAQPYKKPAVAQVQLQDPSGEYCDLSGQTSPYSPYVPTPGPGVSYSNGQGLNASPRPGHHYSTSNASQVSLAAPSPHTPAWSPSFTTVRTEQSPRAPMTPIPRPASACSPHSTMPKLVRTSTMSQQPSPIIGATMQSQHFNPYAMFSNNKASLRLKGDLDAVALDWSEEELEARRKLVVFTRVQAGSAIDAEFKIVPQQDWSRTDITVNCIWWAERKEAFVTSVDTIALLEQLVGVRFTVEEKNRIRRNLEGFRPQTVSKGKSDSEEFFKVIMGFPMPKPRNIEKDVKVFPWKVLSQALKKIISKYSATYSSTASLIQPGNVPYSSTENPGDYHVEQTSVPEMVPHTMSHNAPAHNYPHMMPSRMPAPIPSSIPELSLQVPVAGSPYNPMPTYGYQQMPMPMHAVQMSPYPMTAPVHRVNGLGWDFEGYAPEGHVSHMMPNSAPVSAYPTGHFETADMIPPAAYQTHHR